MTKIITGIVCYALMTAATTAYSSASEPRKAYKSQRAATENRQQLLRSNAYLPAPDSAYPTLSNSQSYGGMSAPAGR